MSEEGFEARWRADLLDGVTGVQLVEVDHPLEVYVGASDVGQPRMQIRTQAKPFLPVLADVVVVERAPVGSSWVLTFTLQDLQFRDVFIRLASHLVSRSRTETEELMALNVARQVLDEWRRMMTPRPPHRLSMESLRGLVGELWYLLERHSSDQAFSDAIDGWGGPLGEPQDFWSAKAGFHEVKSVGPSAMSVRISSAEQLDAFPLSLVVLEVPQVPEGTAEALTMPSLVDTVAGRLNDEDCTIGALEMRLSRLGVDLSDSWYMEQWFRVDSLADFAVDGSFPCIRAQDLPLGVSHVSYAIARSALEPHKKAFEQFG